MKQILIAVHAKKEDITKLVHHTLIEPCLITKEPPSLAFVIDEDRSDRFLMWMAKSGVDFCISVSKME